jgi:hypothetical protein
MSATLLATAPLPAPAAIPSAAARWGGRILTALVALFFAFDAGIKLVGAKAAVDGTVQLGYQPHHVLPIGLLALGCLILYLIPRTAPLGAVLFTGYLGGAIATQLRVDNPLLSHVLFPTYVAAMVWGALYLRDARVRALVHSAR